MIRKRLLSLKRDKAFYNLISASTAGILYSYKNKDSVSIVSSLVQLLSSYNIKSKAIGYYNNKTLPEGYAPVVGEAPISGAVATIPSNMLLCNVALNWYGRPTAPEIDVFINQEYDILIDLSRSDVYVFRYIVALSKAKFKVGGIQYEDNPYDMVFLDSTNDDRLFIDKLVQFLNSIKPAA